MLKMILLFSLIGAVARGDEQARVSANCAGQKEFLSASMRTATSFSRILQQAVDSQSKIIVFGEAHAEDSELFYQWTIRRLKELDARMDCLLIEQPRAKYEEILRACRRERTCEHARLPVFSGVKAALANGLKIYAIDKVADPSRSDFLSDVSERNEAMATNAAAIFKSRQCRRAILIVGALHVHRDPRLVSLADFLAERRLSNYRIELMSPNRNTFGEFDGRWIWQNRESSPLCPESPGALDRNFAFLHGEAARAAVSYYGPYSDPFKGPSEFVGTWGDFDAAMMLGCADPARTRCAPSASNAGTAGYLNP